MASTAIPMATRIAGLLAAAATLVAAFVLAGGPLEHDDQFLHAHTGAWVVEHGAVPRTDPFSHTRAGTPWTSHEWGFGVLLHGLHSVAGFAGWRGLKQVLALALAGGLLALASTALPRDRRSWAPVLAPAVAFAGIAVSPQQLILRASLVTTVFLALTLLGLARLEREGRARWAASLLLGFAFWANLHSGVIFGLAVLALATLESWVAHLRGKPSFLGLQLEPGPGPFAMSGLLLGALAVSLLNPNGIDAVTYPFRLDAYLFWSGTEIHEGHFAPSELGRSLSLSAFSLATVAVGGLAWRRGGLRLAGLLAALAFGVLAWRSSRFALDFAVVATPVLAAGVRALPVAPPRWAIAVPLLAVALAATVATRATWDRPGALLRPTIVSRAGDFLEGRSLPGRLFNHSNFGGYLGWRLGVPVFSDGRSLVFRGLGREVAALSLPELADRYGVGHLVISRFEYNRLKPRRHRDDWACVYWDDVAAVYVRRTPETADLIEVHEYRLVPPFGNPPRWLLDSRRGRDALRPELERALRDNPENQRARLLLANLAGRDGDRDEAIEQLRQALAVRRNDHIARELQKMLGREGR